MRTAESLSPPAKIAWLPARRSRRNQRGSILLPVLCFIFISVGLVVAILDLSTSEHIIASRQVDMDRAMYVAKAASTRLDLSAIEHHQSGRLGHGCHERRGQCRHG